MSLLLIKLNTIINYRYLAGLIFLVSVFVCAFNIGGYAIYILDEAKNSEAAREMLLHGMLYKPTFNNILRTDKPPLHYFFMILGYKIFGVGAFGARFFSSIFGGLTLLITYLFLSKVKHRHFALVAVFVLLSSLFFIQEFHLSVPDPYLIFFLSAALFSFYLFYGEKKKKWLWLFYLSLGLGILTKGPVSILLPGGIVFLFLLFRKELTFSNIKEIEPIVGLGGVLLISAPWFYMAHITTEGEWTKGFFIGHNLNRFGTEMEGHGGGYGMIFLFVILGLLPFSVFLPQSLVHAWKHRKKDPLILFSLVVTSVFILFFSMSSTKLPNYPMPCYPFISIMITAFFLEVYKKRDKKVLSVGLWGLLILCILLPVAGYIVLRIEKQLVGVQGHALFLLIVTFGAIIGFWFYKKDKIIKSFLFFGGSWIVQGMVLFGVVFPKLIAQSPVVLAKKVIDKNTDVLVYKRFDASFPINFHKTYAVVNTVEEVVAFLNNNPNGVVMTNKRGAKETLGILESAEIMMEQKALFENHTTLILRKKRD